MPTTPEPGRTPDGPDVPPVSRRPDAEHAADGGCGCRPARSRRDVLALAGIGVVGGGLLAACGGSDTAGSPATSGPASTAATSAAAPTSAAATTAPVTSAAPTTAAATSAAPTAAGFSVPAADIPVGGGKIFQGQKLVITQPTRGSFKAFSAVCPHQGCLVAAIEDGEIQCPCHASAFAVADGAVLNGPAATGLSTEQVVVSGTTVTVPS